MMPLNGALAVLYAGSREGGKGGGGGGSNRGGESKSGNQRRRRLCSSQQLHNSLLLEELQQQGKAWVQLAQHQGLNRVESVAQQHSVLIPGSNFPS
jgi:hypothetical protein